jgi:hypothetical protein
MVGETSDVKESVLREELTMLLDDHRQTISNNIEKKLLGINTPLQWLNESIAILNTRFDRLVNLSPNNGRLDPNVAAHEQEEFVVDEEILRQEREAFDG